jgi:hypothetical protein
VVDGFVDRPLDIAGPIVVLTPANLPALRGRHISPRLVSPRLATWMSLERQTDLLGLTTRISDA